MSDENISILGLRNELLRLEGRVLSLEGWRMGVEEKSRPAVSKEVLEALERESERRRAEEEAELGRRAAAGVPEGGMAVVEGDLRGWERDWMLDR